MKIIVYKNGEVDGNFELSQPADVFPLLNSKYTLKGLAWRSDLLIRVYFSEVVKEKGKIDIKLRRVNNLNGRLIPEEGSKGWNIELEYGDTKVYGEIFDNTDQTVYVLWEEIQKETKLDLTKEIDNLTFKVISKRKDLTQKSKLVLFFSRKENCGKLWKYSDLNVAMEKEGLKLDGRGIEGERPREFRYAMGYSFKTNEKDKNVPDGYCLVESPFPFGRRNERRVANVDLEKTDWSELLAILKTNPKFLRCKICGLFEGETNRIGQKTKFQKGHFISHLSGGDASNQNIFAICQYCNTEEENIYDIDPKTGKKVWNLIPAINKTDYKSKLLILEFLLKHLKKSDIKKL